MYSEIAANKRKTWLIIFGFIILISGLGALLSTQYGSGLMVGVFAGSIIYALIGYYASARIALSLSQAKPIEQSDNPRLYRIVENLSITAGMPTPKIYIIDDSAPNAFATGRDPNHSHVAFTTGLLALLEDNELEGVAAHELSHIQNYDIRVMSVVLIFVTIIGLLSDVFIRIAWFGGDDDNNGSNPVFFALSIAALIITPLVAMLMQLAVSRRREYLADSSGALLTRYPEGLASALEKIGNHSQPLKKAHTATSHLFLDNPLEGKTKQTSMKFAGLFKTHPPMRERVAKLREMGSTL